MTALVDPLMLPCGRTLPNRLAKAAMTEGLADARNRATVKLERLYGRWGQGGAGLLLTGNVMVDRRYLERPGNVAIDGPQDEAAIAALRSWAAAAKAGGALLVGQVSHAGRQTPSIVTKEPVGPSAVKVKLPGGLYGTPRALSGNEVEEIVRRFARTSKTLVEAGFDGVQIHAAHGYLVSEFLNPLVNRRTDEWGGRLENRARLLLAIVRETRAAIGPEAVLAVKLNSSDFQKGGFSFAECREVVSMLNGEGLDFLEISGGSYEQPKMMGLEGLEPALEEAVRESTKKREAYFLHYAGEISKTAAMPLMVTGGFRTRAGMEEALASGAVHIIGLARPFCGDPDVARKLLEGALDAAPAYERTLRLGPGVFGPTSGVDLLRAANGLATMAWFYRNIVRLGDGRDPELQMNLLGALIAHQRFETDAAQRLERA